MQLVLCIYKQSDEWFLFGANVSMCDVWLCMESVRELHGVPGVRLGVWLERWDLEANAVGSVYDSRRIVAAEFVIGLSPRLPAVCSRCTANRCNPLPLGKGCSLTQLCFKPKPGLHCDLAISSGPATPKKGWY